MNPGSELLQISMSPPDDDPIPWPKHGHWYRVEFEVEYIGKHYEDRPHITVTYCPEELWYLLAENDLWDLVESDEMPIASGKFMADFTFYHYPLTDWETGGREDDYGFEVSGLKHLSPFTQEYYEREA